MCLLHHLIGHFTVHGKIRIPMWQIFLYDAIAHALSVQSDCHLRHLVYYFSAWNRSNLINQHFEWKPMLFLFGLYVLRNTLSSRRVQPS